MEDFMRRIAFLILICIAIMGSGILQSQSVPFTSGQILEVGSRASGMGGAFTAVADDYTALYYNPAGLGQIRSVGVFGSFSQLKMNNQSILLGSEGSMDVSFTKLDAIGVVVPLPTSRGSLVLSFGYHRMRDFGYGMVFGPVDRDVDRIITADSDDYTVAFPMTLSGEDALDGHLSQTSFGGSIEMAPDVFVGGSVNFWSGVKNSSRLYSELGGIYDVPDLVEPGDLWEVMLPDVYFDTYYQEKYSGFNFTLGGFLKAGEHFQFGGVIKTPVTLTGKREGDYYESEWVYEGYEEFQRPDSTSHFLLDDYEVQLPWIFCLGAAMTYGPLVISGDIEFCDYSQIKYKTQPPDELDGTMTEVNRSIRNDFRSTLNYRIGAQVTLPGTNASLRAGYAVYPSHWKDADSDWNRKIVSFGAGYDIENFFRIDISYSFSSWHVPTDISYPLYLWDLPEADEVTREKLDMKRIMVSMSYQTY